MPFVFHKHRNFFINFGTSLILVGQIFWSSSLMATNKFFSAIDDLPLMAGLAEVRGSTLVFSKPQGRIVEVIAEGVENKEINKEKILAFYKQTLPQLGWILTGKFSWERESEQLFINVSFEGNNLRAEFVLLPKSEGKN